MKETETAPTTPEQLLQMLDGQLAMQRAQRGTGGRNRTMLLVGGVLFIVIAAGVALMVLAQMLSDLPQNGRHPATAKSAPAGNF